jgi:hypothetical protein
LWVSRKIVEKFNRRIVMNRRTLLIALHTLILMPVFLAAPIYALGTLADIVVSEPLSYVRLYCDSDGESHFADEVMPFTLIDFAPPAPPVSVSAALAAESVAIISSAPGWRGDWHSVPRKQLMFVLSGELEVEVTDGEIRQLNPGSITLVEDISCKGHVSRVIGNERCYMATVPLRTD